MDQHPIPQDVTGFQFKLIGSMTVKQFGYVATGVVFAVILYYLPLKISLGFLIKTILLPLFGASGFIIAFVPIEGRPIDVMVRNFLIALFAPNQYVYHKMGRRFSFSTIAISRPQMKIQTTTNPTQKHTPAVHRKPEYARRQQLQAFLRTSHNKHNALDDKEETFLHSLDSLSFPFASDTSLAQPTLQPIQWEEPQTTPKLILTPSPLPPPLPPKKEEAHLAAEEISKQEVVLKNELEKAKKEASTSPDNHQQVDNLEMQLEKTHVQKEQLERELNLLKKELSSKNATLDKTQITTKPGAGAHTRNIPQQMTKNVGIAYVPDTPNVVVGIVKDPRGNVLPSVLVEIKDKDKTPVRAFKTNALGQFASATPLSPGSFTIEIEDPKKQNLFDVVQITVKNEIMSPIEIISHDAREELRKALFN